MLLGRYVGSPWNEGREVPHAFRGLVDVRQANEVPTVAGHGHPQLVDNGEIDPSETRLQLPATPHVYDLLPRTISKPRAVATHMAARGYRPGECAAIGNSPADREIAAVVERFFLVTPDVRDVAGLEPESMRNVRVVNDVYEAVIGL